MSFSSRFVKDELISQGQAFTWKGRDTQTGDPVVIKELQLDDRSQWKGLELFEREVQVMRQLKHPSIPALLDADLGQSDPLLWRFAQKWIPGVDLRQAPPLDATAIRELAKQILNILVYLQTFSPPLIHRDIKPANIILGDERPFLVDFGAVQLVTPSDEGGSTVVGTSGYMAPEQLMGRTSASSDLYGLGMTLVWLVTRQEPEALPVSRMRTIWQDALCLPISSDFRVFIDRLISPLEEDRFADAAEALTALEEGNKTAIIRSRPKNSRLELHKSNDSFEVIRRPQRWVKFGALACLMSAAAGVWLVAVSSFFLAYGGWILVGTVFLLLGAIVLGMSGQTLRLHIEGGTWRYHAGGRSIAKGPTTEIQGFSHINMAHDARRLALLCTERSYPLFQVQPNEQDWLDDELRHFLGRRV